MNTKQKVVWLINHHACPPQFERHQRTIKFASFLKRKGYEVYIISAGYMYFFDKTLMKGIRFYKTEKYDDLNFIHLNTYKYGNNWVLRAIGYIQFSIVLFLIRKRLPKPDIIHHTAYVPFENLIYYTVRSLKAKYIVELVDLWTRGVVIFGIIKKTNPLLKAFLKAEKWLFKKADKLIFSMEGGADYIIDRKWNISSGGPISLENVHYINNGVDIKEFDILKETNVLKDPLLDNNKLFKVIYIGSMRLANNLKLLIDAASHLKEIEDLVIVLYGDGVDRENLENHCKANNITNVIFKDKWVTPYYVPSILDRSSLNILNYMEGFGGFGSSPSKLFQYLASGKPLCANIVSKYDLIQRHNLGISKNFSNGEDYANAIRSIYNMNEEEYNKICKNVRHVANDFDYNVLTNKLIGIYSSL